MVDQIHIVANSLKYKNRTRGFLLAYTYTFPLYLPYEEIQQRVYGSGIFGRRRHDDDFGRIGVGGTDWCSQTSG